MSVPTVYLARHGETEWSRNGRHTGRTDLLLTPAGEEDGRRLGQRLAGVTFSRVFSSPLGRARRTAELAGFAPELDPDLLEWDYGTNEGKTGAEIRAANPGWLLFRDGCPGGESPADIAARVDRLAARLKALDGNVLCFAHGHLLRVLAARWVGQPVALAASLLLGTATLCVLSFDHGNPHEPAIKVWNSG
ncbi:MAG: histidine phosphatase family protein [Isosphaera sp.]|nr:histidine phosphatase family protein [Isosphaera sp.]